MKLLIVLATCTIMVLVASCSSFERIAIIEHEPYVFTDCTEYYFHDTIQKRYFCRLQSLNYPKNRPFVVLAAVPFDTIIYSPVSLEPWQLWNMVSE